jgi:hypothetical protein
MAVLVRSRKIFQLFMGCLDDIKRNPGEHGFTAWYNPIPV